MHTFLVFPHQLFEDVSALRDAQATILVEESLFFTQYAFHQQKIALHRASMQYYAHHLGDNGISCRVVASTETSSDIRVLLEILAKNDRVTHITAYTPDDEWLQRRMESSCAKYGVHLRFVPHPGFINTSDALLPRRKDGSIVQTDWYVRERKRLGILIEADTKDKPLGGQWTYDTENRLKYPAKKTPPNVWFPGGNTHTREAEAYTHKYFSNNPGSLRSGLIYPVTHADARLWLEDFLVYRFAEFGPYEDAIVAREHWLHHSVLTPMLNIGLLTPAYVVDRSLEFAGENGIPLSSLEGFIRQIIGWREFMRLYYVQHGREQRTRNFWGFTRRIPAAFYDGTTGITPVDACIRKLLDTGYNHHIERLMVLGNFMLLCEFDPDEVYRWFMEMYIDAYDWVMVPNVYGMSQFADGGGMTTKPYISGSNYIAKMSDFKRDGVWDVTWDALFWRFMQKQRTFFGTNLRLGMLLKTLDRMPEAKRAEMWRKAEEWDAKMDG
ncbi:MAG: cryptochrome/photolyase family protein [Candidatus Kapaibacterium sp.]